jgi:hypothetical protein
MLLSHSDQQVLHRLYKSYSQVSTYVVDNVIPRSRRSNMSATIECPICYDHITTPSSTLCGHLFCAACMNRLFDEPDLKCAICRRPLDSSELEDVDTAVTGSLDTANCGTGEQQLPAGWEQRYNPLGSVYFADHNTRTTTRDDPRR